MKMGTGNTESDMFGSRETCCWVGFLVIWSSGGGLDQVYAYLIGIESNEP